MMRNARSRIAVAFAAAILLCGCGWIPGLGGGDATAPDAETTTGTADDDTTAVATDDPDPDARPPAIRITIPPEERARLSEQIERDLRIGADCLRTVAERGDLAGNTETIAVLRQLLADAKKARAAGDLRRAARLSSKARILAEELRCG
ncbi:MAG: hypothetical protein GF346_09170 [Candidatus Eisenbacteria bacterium]|nr:hypothetical protein [Candidatus Latescibacterota bacterium]MBD3302601.1 hypothetical protein [Candidatus Eisenbacteria bacterium]